jgi:hypothetical protein
MLYFSNRKLGDIRGVEAEIDIVLVAHTDIGAHRCIYCENQMLWASGKEWKTK